MVAAALGIPVPCLWGPLVAPLGSETPQLGWLQSVFSLSSWLGRRIKVEPSSLTCVFPTRPATLRSEADKHFICLSFLSLLTRLSRPAVFVLCRQTFIAPLFELGKRRCISIRSLPSIPRYCCSAYSQTQSTMSSSTPPTVTTPDEPQNEGSKLRTFLGILKK